MNNNNVLVEEEFEFRTKSTTERVTYNLLHQIVKASNKKVMVEGIFNDREKAFDFVNYNILLSQLKVYGITGKASALLKSYI